MVLNDVEAGTRVKRRRDLAMLLQLTSLVSSGAPKSDNRPAEVTHSGRFIMREIRQLNICRQFCQIIWIQAIAGMAAKRTLPDIILTASPGLSPQRSIRGEWSQLAEQ